MEDVRSETLVTAEEEHPGEDSVSTENVASNKTLGTLGRAQNFEEEDSSEDYKAPVQRKAKRW